MKNKPFFSVVIPLYNKEKYVKRAVDSVLNQTFRDFEIIIVNDGSTDKSLSVVRKIRDNRIKIINQKNLGLDNARNNGIKKAESDYISFLDADDEHAPLFLETVYGLIKKYKKYVFFATAFKKVCGDGSEFYTVCGRRKDFVVKNFLAAVAETGKFFIHVSSVVVKKNVFEEIGYFYSRSAQRNAGTAVVGDFDLWTRISRKYSLVYSNFAGCTYYTNTPVNMIRGYGSGELDCGFYGDRLNDMILESASESEKRTLKKILYKFYNLAAVQSLIRGFTDEAEQYLDKQPETEEVLKIRKMIKLKRAVKSAQK